MWPLPKSSGDSSMGAATAKDGWGWHQAGLGHGRTPQHRTRPALSPQPTPAGPSERPLPRQGLRCLGGTGQGTVGQVPLLRAQGGDVSTPCTAESMGTAPGRRDLTWPLCHRAATALPGAGG